MLDLRKLLLLRELHARGTVAAVAEALAFTPSAVSQQLAQLQREAGVPLTERVGRRLRLTDAGLRLVEHADVILAHLEAAEREARALTPAAAPPLTLGSLPSAAALVARAASELLRDRPELRLRVVGTDPARSLPGLRGGELDLALLYAYEGVEHERPGWLQETVLLDDPILLALPARHRLAASDGVELAELAGERFIVEPFPEPHGFTIVACRRAGFSPAVAAYSSDYDVTLALVAAGFGVALVPELAVREAAGVAVRRLAGPQRTRRLTAATRVGDARTPDVAAALGALRRAAHG
jgi:DNA-binding transcriptional LysR family regulator